MHEDWCLVSYVPNCRRQEDEVMAPLLWSSCVYEFLHNLNLDSTSLWWASCPWAWQTIFDSLNRFCRFLFILSCSLRSQLILLSTFCAFWTKEDHLSVLICHVLPIFHLFYGLISYFLDSSVYCALSIKLVDQERSYFIYWNPY